MKILLVTAMPTESEDIIQEFGMTQKGKLVNFFHHYSVTTDTKEIFLLQTHVGSINAPTAVALALQEIKPDVVIKVGCVGANTPGIKKNDIVIPSSFFHTGAWITRSYRNNEPTSDASVWQTLYGDEPYQNSKTNLGGLDCIFLPDNKLIEKYKTVLENEKISYVQAHLGSGDMVIFDHSFMDNIQENVLKLPVDTKWCSDNESYAIAQVCKIFNVPFTGIYFVASSDYEDVGGYDPDAIRHQTQQTILPIVKKLCEQITP